MRQIPSPSPNKNQIKSTVYLFSDALPVGLQLPFKNCRCGFLKCCSGQGEFWKSKSSGCNFQEHGLIRLHIWRCSTTRCWLWRHHNRIHWSPKALHKYHHCRRSESWVGLQVIILRAIYSFCCPSCSGSWLVSYQATFPCIFLFWWDTSLSVINYKCLVVELEISGEKDRATW